MEPVTHEAVLLCLMALSAAPLAAQTPSFVGSWQLSYPRGKTIENGEETIIWGKGVLTIVSQGDSLIGTLVGEPVPDLPPRPPARLAAAATTGEANFHSRTEATMNHERQREHGDRGELLEARGSGGQPGRDGGA